MAPWLRWMGFLVFFLIVIGLVLVKSMQHP